MKLKEIKALRPQIQEIANKYGIKQIYIFGSVARGESVPQSDIDFLIDMQEGASMLGVGGFSYEIGKLLGVEVDVIPTSVLPRVDDKDFTHRIQTEAVAL